MRYLGVDGGGTKTDFMIIDDKGKIWGYTRRNSCHYIEQSIDTFKKVLEEGVNEVCKKANIDISNITYSFLGLPAFGEVDKDIPKLRKIVENILKSKSYKCGNDVEVGWAGSLACQPGINIVSGTGSIGYGIDQRGNKIRVGGWGYFCGDEGSGYWLGKKAIELFTKESDGRLEKTPIYCIIKDELNIERDFDLINIIYNELAFKRSEIASISKLLYKAAKKGDNYAKTIFKEAAYEQSLTIKAIIKKLDFNLNDNILVSYSGGVFNAGEYILSPLKEYVKNINKSIKIVEPIFKPITGASLYALMLHKEKSSKDIINILKFQEKTVFQRDL